MPGLLASLLFFQTVGAGLALRRLARWRRLPPPVAPRPPDRPADVTIVIPVFNEAARLAPLLAGLECQAVAEVIVVDSRSTDGTQALVETAADRDARLRLLTDDPLPDGWIGKAWALECARQHVRTAWILFLDADTDPRADIAGPLTALCEREQCDAVSLAPRFAGQSPAERWLQPSLLVSLLYRFAPGTDRGSSRTLANGQCFLVRTTVLDRCGGFAPVKASFAEDVSLAAHLARSGARVAFRDGANLYDVRSYSSAAQMWREWGRSIDLKDATTPVEQCVDVASIIAVQGIPLPLLVLAICGLVPLASPLLVLNAALFAVRCALLPALAHSYAARGVTFWLSPLSDPLAALRVVMSSLRRPSSWRGRSYQPGVRR